MNRGTAAQDPTTVALIVGWRGEGRTLGGITAELNRRGVPNATGGRWHDSLVRRICAHPDRYQPADSPTPVGPGP